jgi:hypothetical protein
VLGAGDFFGTGHAGILWQGDNGAADIWQMNGTMLVTGSLIGPNLGTSWHVRTVADYNGDGHADIGWQNDDGSVQIWLMNGFTVSSTSVLATNPGPSVQLTAQTPLSPADSLFSAHTSDVGGLDPHWQVAAAGPSAQLTNQSAALSFSAQASNVSGLDSHWQAAVAANSDPSGWVVPDNAAASLLTNHSFPLQSAAHFDWHLV